MGLNRFASLKDRREVEEQQGDDYIVELALASEEPYERWWGVEILDCAPESVRLGRLNDGAPLLYNHKMDDLRGTHQPGTARCDADRIVRAQVRITAVTQAGRDAIGLVKSNVLVKVSVGYQIHHVIEQTTSKSGEVLTSRKLDGSLFERVLKRSEEKERGDVTAFRRHLDAAAGAFERAAGTVTVYRVIDWEPHEDSLVTVPADNTVGVGRLHETEASATQAAPPAAPSSKADEGAGVTGTEESRAGDIHLSSNLERINMDKQDVAPAPEKKAPDHLKRVTEILALGEQFKQFNGVSMANDALRSGESVEAFTSRLMKHLGEQTEKFNPSLDLSAKEVKSWSLFRAINAKVTDDWSKAGFERECHEQILTIAERAGMPIKGGFFMPAEVRKLHAARALGKMHGMQQRDINVANDAQGGYLVGTDHRADEFVDLLRATSLAGRVGVRFISGLVGDFSAPKKTASTTAYWLANETTAITESQPTLGQLLMSPKHVGGYTEISRLALLQSAPDAEAIAIDDLRDTLVLGIDAAWINGAGTGGAPTGVLNTSGIGSVTGTSLAYAGIVECQTDLASANALSEICKYVAPPAVAGLLMQRQRFTSTDTPLWKGSMLEGEMAGFPALGSTQVPAATLLFGNFADVVIGEWGVLEITVNPFAGFTSGVIGVRAMAAVDVGVRRAASFTAASTIT